MYQPHIDYSFELETGIIGACLLEKSAIARIYNTIKPDHFYGADTGNVAKAIWEMFERSMPIDLLTVCDYLIRQKGFFHLSGSTKQHDQDANDIPYQLTKMTNAVTSTANLEYHSHILKQMFIQREIKRLKFGPEEDLRSLQKQLSLLNENTTDDGWLSMDELMVKLYQHQDEMLKTEGKGLQTGFKNLDDLNGGFFPGNLIVIGARPSMGKSAFAGQIALNVARQNKKVGIISLEMNNNEISGRIASIDTSIDFAKLYRAMFDDEKQRDSFYNRVNSSTSKLPIWITDKTGVRAIDIKAKASVLKAKEGLDLLIIDYLQLIVSDANKNRNRENEISEISRTCKIIAKELECPVIELCQLNRAVTARKGHDRYPMLSDLRESGSIEQDADVVMFLHRDWLSGIIADPQTGESTEGDADLLVRKWRNGRLAHIRLDFIGSRMMFQEKIKSGFRPYTPETDNYQNTNPF